MTEYERSLYYTNNGIRKKLPFRERISYILFAVAAFLDSFLLYGIFFIILGDGALLACLFYVIFIVVFLKKFKQIKQTTYAATYANSNDPESWKSVYKSNMRITKICFILTLPLVAAFFLVAHYFY